MQKKEIYEQIAKIDKTLEEQLDMPPYSTDRAQRYYLHGIYMMLRLLIEVVVEKETNSQ